MTKDNWLRFIWDLKSLPNQQDSGDAKGKYSVRRALRKEHDVVQRVMEASFRLDSDWGLYNQEIERKLERILENAFRSKSPDCIALVDGSRIVGVSLFDLSENTASHLATGPCILIEYRSRGFGSRLLRESLAFLKEQGLETACGITPADSVAARYVYPKCNGKPEPFTFSSPASETKGE